METHISLSESLCLRLGAPNHLTSYLCLDDMGTYDHIQLILQERMCLHQEIPSFCHIYCQHMCCIYNLM